MNKKKVLFHINSMGKGGAERVVSILSKYFVEDVYEVVVVTLWRAEEEYPLVKEVKRINLEDAWQKKKMGRFERALMRLWDFRRILKTEKPDIVISFCNKANFRCAFAMFGMKTPLLISVRNDPKIDYLPYKAAVKRMERKASGCVFQTPDAKAYFGKVLQKKSRIIWNPIDERYLTTDAVNNEQLSFDIVSVGRISEQKNQMLLLKAFARVREQLSDYRILLYGGESEPESERELIEYVKTEKLDEQVCFMGQSEHLEQDIKDAALFVLSSDYEGMPNALIEAMALGLPVISTDCPCGGPAELIENEVSGILVPVGDEEALASAMLSVLQNPVLAQNLGVNAKKIIQKVSPWKIYEEWRVYATELMK